MSIREWLHGLQEQVWELAKTSLQEGDSEAYHVLMEFAERLQNLALGEKSEQGKPIEIFSLNGQHRAQMDLARIAGRRGKCVLLNGQWHTTSGIGSKLAGYPVNGWAWWQYRNDKGETRPIDDFRES